MADDATVIDGNSSVEGKLTGRDARILGRFRGDIDVSGRLTVGEGAKVEANVSAEAAEIAGEFQGELRCASVVILEKGRVAGSLETHKLAVRDGAVLNAAVTATGPKAGPAPVRGVAAG